MPCSPQTSPDLALEVDLPLIDLSRFAQTSHDAHYDENIANVKLACQEWGFFRVVDHRIPKTLLQDVESAVEQLCAMPEEAKQRWATEDPKESYRNQPGMESIALLNLPHSDSVLQMSRKIWPQDGNPLFCKSVEAYTHLLADLGQTITKTLLASLDLDVGRFYESDFQNCTYRMRINHYSSDGKSTEDAVFAHTDLGVFAILNTNKGGLQIRSKEGMWFNVKPLPHSFVIILGDSFKAWSNGRYRSAEHRVVQRGWKDRIALPYFVDFPQEKKIWAPAELVDDHHPRCYKLFSLSDFKRSYYESSDKAAFVDRYAGL